ncbi:gamma-glutamyl-gamma-aminobutyrate hydrolase family protein [Balneolales bacterium ANBcel1]|nr:gamma-glutamyl-gamma-aminobutyrate hydrolase family protein [Balneolales bacterium ANBcel1]
MSRKPIVWVSGPDKGGGAAWLATRYALRRSGARARRITPRSFEKVRSRTPGGHPHALVLGGGADIDPGRYEDLVTDLKNIRTTPDPNEPKGQRWITLILAPFFLLVRKAFSAGALGVDKQRDDLEWKLIDMAVQKQIPILGICRGAQLLNVYHKGTLYQDLANYYRERPNVSTIYPRKPVTLDPESRLHAIIGKDVTRVNSLHNQAVKQPGEGIHVVARELDGVAQAVEHRTYPFMIGVQWHPEYLPQVPSQRRLFDELVQSAILHRDNSDRTPAGNDT